MDVKSRFEQRIKRMKEENQKQYWLMLKEIVPNVTLEQSIQIYQKTISMRQSTVSMTGKAFEDTVEELLRENNIEYRKQISINLQQNKVQNGKSSPVVDFVIGHGDDLQDLIVVSCKHTCKERASQDDWSLLHIPKKYFLVVATSDYPSKFEDTKTRKLFTLQSKKNENRLTMSDFMNEIKEYTKSSAVPHPEYKFIDLCCGIGSFHYAMRDSGKCVLACDILTAAQKTYERNYKIRCLGDLTKIDYAKYNADIVFSGNPCQSFSNIGKRNGFADERGDLFNYIIDNIIGIKKYKVVVFENVIGLCTHDSGNTLRYIITKIESYGYSVIYRTLLCSDYGIPQNRKRIFIICFRDMQHNTGILDDILKKNESKTTLTEYLDNGLKFKRDTAFTIRCGGAHSPIKSKQNWDGYYLEDGTEYRLTIDDMKRLQGFPSSFKLIGTATEQQKLLGNTIPTNLTKIICEYVVTMLTDNKIIKNIIEIIKGCVSSIDKDMSNSDILEWISEEIVPLENIESITITKELLQQVLICIENEGVTVNTVKQTIKTMLQS